MSTKQESDSTIKFDPTSLLTYQGLQTPLKNTLLDYMQDPLKASYFAQQVQQLSKANQGLLARNTGNILTQATARGLSPNSALTASLINRAQRGSSANMNNAYLAALQKAEETRMWATNQAQNYRPLQTGSHSVQTTSGLGTWLPQLVSTGLSLAIPMLGGMNAMTAAGTMSTIGQGASQNTGWANAGGSGGGIGSGGSYWNASNSFLSKSNNVAYGSYGG